ncbi:hypothetical protein [Tunturiibacter psychrotolerans]|uniref:hypothetical protein n=1 Tax=Tunturiibacter psychrotolerans TaxID=3069686 RepID=UPI003D1D4BBB
MSDPNHVELMEQIHSAEVEIEALENKIANCDESVTSTADLSVLRVEQEEHRQRILKCKAGIIQNRYSD